MSSSVDPDETAQYEPSHLDLRCLQRLVIKCIACGIERVKVNERPGDSAAILHRRQSLILPVYFPAYQSPLR